MKIEQKKVDDLTLQLNISIDKADAQEKKKKALGEYRKKADIKGFRKGMAPMSLIEKMHGLSALVEGVNSLISESINNYIVENKLNILGEPLPNDELQNKIDWENDETYEFVFDIALNPEVNFTLTKEDKIDFNTVEVAKKEVEAYKSNMLKQFGKLENTEVVKEDDFIIADLTQGETSIEGTYITLKQMPDQESKDLFLGKKVGDVIELDVNKVFVNEADRAALLKVKKEELADINPNYTVTIKEVKEFVEAEENQDLYDRIFGEGNVKTKKEFEEKVKERIAEQYIQESEYKFALDSRDYLIEKANIQLPEAFLKKWLFTLNEGKFTMEQIEKDFHLFLKDFRWQLIRQYIVREQKIQITREDLVNEAKKIAKYQFAMYGLNDVPADQLEAYANSILQKEDEGRRIYEKTEEVKVLDYVKNAVTIEDKKVSAEKMREMTA